MNEKIWASRNLRRSAATVVASSSESASNDASVGRCTRDPRIDAALGLVDANGAEAEAVRALQALDEALSVEVRASAPAAAAARRRRSLRVPATALLVLGLAAVYARHETATGATATDRGPVPAIAADRAEAFETRDGEAYARAIEPAPGSRRPSSDGRLPTSRMDSPVGVPSPSPDTPALWAVTDADRTRSTGAPLPIS